MRIKDYLSLEQVRFIATRFAHECKLQGCQTNDDTIKLYDSIVDKILEKL